MFIRAWSTRAATADAQRLALAWVMLMPADEFGAAAEGYLVRARFIGRTTAGSIFRPASTLRDRSMALAVAPQTTRVAIGLAVAATLSPAQMAVTLLRWFYDLKSRPPWLRAFTRRSRRPWLS